MEIMIHYGNVGLKAKCYSMPGSFPPENYIHTDRDSKQWLCCPQQPSVNGPTWRAAKVTPAHSIGKAFLHHLTYMLNIITKPDTREFKNFLYQKFRDLNLRKSNSMDLSPS